jgi:hypothetical protein
MDFQIFKERFEGVKNSLDWGFFNTIGELLKTDV